MAKILTEEILKALKKFDLPKGYQRTGEFPLDPSSVFGSKADADLYAAGGADSRGLSGTRYAGQLIAVVENNVTTLYTVEADDTLKAVGGDVSADLSTLTNKVDALLAGDHEGIDSLADVKAKFDALKDLVVESGVVRVPTEEELAADSTLVSGDLYIVLTIKNSSEKLYIPAKALVDVYTGSDYIEVSNTNEISLNVSTLEGQLVTDNFAKKSDITDITDTLATKESVNTLDQVVKANAQNITTNTNEITSLKTSVEEKANQTALNTLNETVNSLKANVEEIKVKDVDTTTSNGISLNLSNTGVVGLTVDVSALTTAVKENLDLNSNEIKLSANIGGTEGNPNYAAGTTVQDVLSGMDSRIKANAESIASAVAGGVTSITAGDGIAVDTTGEGGTTQPKVSIKVSTDSNLTINAGGYLDLIWLE